MSSFPFSTLEKSDYIVWLNDEQHNHQILRIAMNGDFIPWIEALYDKATGMVTPLAELDDATFNGLPHVFDMAWQNDVADRKADGWQRGASITVPWDDPRRSAPGAMDLNNADKFPRWEEGTGPAEVAYNAKRQPIWVDLLRAQEQVTHLGKPDISTKDALVVRLTKLQQEVNEVIGKVISMIQQ